MRRALLSGDEEQVRWALQEAEDRGHSAGSLRGDLFGDEDASGRDV